MQFSFPNGTLTTASEHDSFILFFFSYLIFFFEKFILLFKVTKEFFEKMSGFLGSHSVRLISWVIVMANYLI